MANHLDGPFAVINADDFYGPSSYEKIVRFFGGPDFDDNGTTHAMVGFKLKNTVSGNGHVARGVCGVSPEGLLENIAERTKVVRRKDGSIGYEDTGAHVPLDPDCHVSMNCWAFSPSKNSQS